MSASIPDKNFTGAIKIKEARTYDDGGRDYFTQEWWGDGKLHREDGPAVIYPFGTKEWWIKGRRHREDGPAIESPDGHREFWLNGNLLSEEEFNQWLDKKRLNEKLHSTLPPKPMIKRGKI